MVVMCVCRFIHMSSIPSEGSGSHETIVKGGGKLISRVSGEQT